MLKGLASRDQSRFAQTESVFDCRGCGDKLSYGRVFALSAIRRAVGRRATRADMVCCDCQLDEQWDRPSDAEVQFPAP
jgi:hypothetical protein